MTPEEKKQLDQILNETSPYMKGGQNKVIRWYFYVDRGLDVLNQFRNLFLGILAGYIALRLDNPVLLVASFVPAVLILGLVGWYQTHRMAKVFEWIGIRFSTYYGLRQFNYQKGTYDLLFEIKKLLEEQRKNV